MFQQQVVNFRGFIAKEYKNFTSNYTLKEPHIKTSKHTKVIVIVQRVIGCEVLVFLCYEPSEDDNLLKHT
jgi:hypothetical protein